MTDKDILLKKAQAAMQQAYAPYSKFLVGACVESANGKLYSGCNIENASYGLTICAEPCAICAMIADGETEIKQIAVMTTGPGLVVPCGACRQRIFEFATPATVIHAGNLQGDTVSYSINDLLPHAFSKNDLENAGLLK